MNMIITIVVVIIASIVSSIVTRKLIDKNAGYGHFRLARADDEIDGYYTVEMSIERDQLTKKKLILYQDESQ